MLRARGVMIIIIEEAEAELIAVFRDDEAHAATAKSSVTRCLEAVTPSDTETESDSGDEDAETRKLREAQFPVKFQSRES